MRGFTRLNNAVALCPIIVNVKKLEINGHYHSLIAAAPLDKFCNQTIACYSILENSAEGH